MFPFVAINDLLEERRIRNDVTVNFFTSLLHVTNRLHVAMCLFSNAALLGVNFDKRHGLETATREPRTGDE